MIQPSFIFLSIKDLSLQVRLGCSAEERQFTQEVRIGAEIQFSRIPQGMISDRLEETICYAEISNAFREWCLHREFALVEKLAYELFVILREMTGADSKVNVSVHKVSPPVEGLTGGVVCCVGDLS